MFKMLLEELEWAVEDVCRHMFSSAVTQANVLTNHYEQIWQGEPYNFDYFLFISKVYKEIESSLNDEQDGEDHEDRLKPKKKKKKKAVRITHTLPTHYS